MKDKIKYILQREGLTNVRFAEMLGIQASTVSHLLSGRNKPSFDLIQSVLRQFPRVNTEWFMLDRGEPYRAEISDSIIERKDQDYELDLFNVATDENSDPQVESVENMRFSESLANESKISTNMPESLPLTPPTPPFVVSDIEIPSKKEEETLQSAKSPQPIRVMVFYDDGTCESYSMR